MARTVPQLPVTIWPASTDLTEVIQGWVRESLRPVEAEEWGMPCGTVLLRSGGTWDSLLGFTDRSDSVLSPMVIFKNPVPLWQYTWQVIDGPLSAETWLRLRRILLIHNPGLGGFLSLIDEVLP